MNDIELNANAGIGKSFYAPTIPTLSELFKKLYPSADTSPEERILFTGYLVGMCARYEEENKSLREQLTTMQILVRVKDAQRGQRQDEDF